MIRTMIGSGTSQKCSVPDVPYEGNEEAYSAYWKEEGEFLKTVLIEIDHVGHMEGEPRHIIYLKKSCITGCIWESTQLDTLLETSTDWDKILEDMCKKLGIIYKQPHWELTAYYG